MRASLSRLEICGSQICRLDRFKFYGADLPNADLTAIVTGANFSNTVWSNTRWIDGEYYDSQPLMLLTDCELVPYAYCAGADLSHMNLSGLDLTGIDLRGANLQNTNLDFATLDGADLRSIVAFNATFIHTGMNRTYLQNAEFNNMISANVEVIAAQLT